MTYNFSKKLLAKIGADKDCQEIVGMLLTMCIWILMLIGFITGYSQANNEKLCRATNIGEIILSPMYALGCNIGKDRFDQKLN